MKAALLNLILAFAWVVASGCGNNNAPQPASQSEAAKTNSKGVIGLSVLTLSNPFFKTIGDSMAAAAAKEGYEVVVVSGDFDVARQQNQVKDFIVRKVAAIVLTPCDSVAIGPAIQEANDAGIPVFTADIACLAKGPKVVTHIATDNFGGGVQAGLGMIQALAPAGGKVAVIHHKVVESCILRVNGFTQAITNHNQMSPSGKIDIVAELPGGGAKDGGFRAAEDLLQAHSDLRGIFAINDPSALGARAALEKAGKADHIVLIGFDGSPEGKAAVKAGKLHASPVQFPERIGSETFNAILKHFAGEKLPPETLIPTALYKKADADQDPSVK
ncbi:MAG TPA: substrate-binding domain-containing protein [Methylomirabilota bacterium]|nr:substrate-binding domain-containing protein [Methylomirabilota bacterium]